MIRITTIFFCLVLAAAAAGRYQAEAKLRADRDEVRRLDQQIDTQSDIIKDLQLEVEVLESAPRLTRLAQENLALNALQPEQLVTVQEMAGLLDMDKRVTPVKRTKPASDLIGNAIAMADFGITQ